MLSLKELDVKGKKVLMRVDFNVPFDDQGNITDDSRMRAALPSIQYVLDHGGSLILMTHLGRPKGTPSAKLSLKHCLKKLEDLLQRPVIMAPDCIGDEVSNLAKNLKPGQVLLLENLRFHRAEEKPQEDPSFAEQLASLGDLYVNDAFGTAHRAHSSTTTIAQYFPGKSAAGFLIEQEIRFFKPLLNNPKRPFYAIIGGAKVSSKIGILKSLVSKVDALFIGGGMAYTFMKAQGKSIGNSLFEEEFLGEASELLKLCQASQVPCYLPIDHVVSDQFSNEGQVKVILDESGIPPGYQGMDIGPKTIDFFAEHLKNAQTILWNGPLGVFEFSRFAKGTEAIAKALANSSANTIVGGGDSIAALNQLGLANKLSHLSTGGGASLEYLEFGKLPGIEALETNNSR